MDEYSKLSKKILSNQDKLETSVDSVEHLKLINIAISKYPDSVSFINFKISYLSGKIKYLSEYNAAIELFKMPEIKNFGNTNLSFALQVYNYQNLKMFRARDSVYSLLTESYYRKHTFRDAELFLVASKYILDKDAFSIIYNTLITNLSDLDRQRLDEALKYVEK